MLCQCGINGGQHLVDVLVVDFVPHRPSGPLIWREVDDDTFSLFKLIEHLAQVSPVGGPPAGGEYVDELSEIKRAFGLRKNGQEAQLRPTPAESEEVINPCVIAHRVRFHRVCCLYKTVHERRPDFEIRLACLWSQVGQSHKVALGDCRIEGNEMHGPA